MYTEPFDTIYVMENVSENFYYYREHELIDRIRHKANEEPNFGLMQDLGYLKVYNNLRRLHGDSYTFMFIFHRGELKKSTRYYPAANSPY